MTVTNAGTFTLSEALLEVGNLIQNGAGGVLGDDISSDDSISLQLL